MNNKLTQFTTHNSLLKRISAIVTKCHLQNYNPSNYSGTHSLIAHLNCLRNFCSCAIGCLLSRAGFANAHTAPYRKFAFTLAETLIVMGIIGVVAALTLPNLNSSTGDKEKVAKVKKIYSNLNDAMGRAIAVYGPYNEWGSDSNGAVIAGRLSEFMKLSKNCDSSNYSQCLSTKGKTVFNIDDAYSSSNQGGTGLLLADGTGLLITRSNFNPRRIYIDIDGPNAGSNMVSKDIFSFDIDSNTGEIIPTGTSALADGVSSYSACMTNGMAECTAWVVQNENLDYIKCASSLNDNKTSCK